MTLPLWGSLEKSQDDDSTIDDAIAQAIADHNDDPDAHLSSGQSLEAHKTQDIIDHPASSVVLDKIPFNLYTLGEGDLELLGWSDEVGSASSNTASAFNAQCFGAQNEYEGLAGFPFQAFGDYPDEDLMFQMRLIINVVSDASDDFIFAFFDNDIDDDERIVFEKEGTIVYLRFYVGGVVVEEYELVDGDTFLGVVRFWYESTADTIHVYINDTEVITYVSSDWQDLVLGSIELHMVRSSSAFMAFGMSKWKNQYTLDPTTL